MLQNHIRISLRNLQKNKLFTAIKIVGLTTGITACLLIGLYLRYELSYDAFHEKTDRIARVTMEFSMEGTTREVGVTGNKVVPSFRRDFPEVESGVRIIPYTLAVKYADQLFEEKNFYFADSTFFDIFTFPLLQGNPKTALNSPNQVVITKRMAAKYFGSENPLGKTIKAGATGEYEITGVMADPPANSHLQPSFVGSIVSLKDMKPERSTWWNANYGAYLLLRDARSLAGLQAKIPAYMRQFDNETNASGDNYLRFRLEPLRSVHLYSRVESIFEPNGDARYLYILSAVGLFILLIGGITYVNLTTAVSTERAREVGIQKVLGAERNQLFWQYLAEAGVFCGIALILAYGLAAPLAPLFGRLIGRPITLAPLFELPTVLAALTFTALISLLAGAYPALVISNYQPVKVLKGQFKNTASGAWLRKSLIVLQFGISVLLIVSTLIFRQQLNFIQNTKLGYDRSQVLVLATDQKVVDKIEAFKTEFLKNKNVRSVSLVYESPVEIKGGYGIDKSVSGNNLASVQALPTDEDFVRTMNMELAAGSGLSKQDVELVRRQQQGIDTASAISILINETQAKLFGWSPAEAVGRPVNFNGRISTIKGVLKDFHFASFHEPIGNLVVFPDVWGNAMLVKLQGRQLQSDLDFLARTWASLAPHRPFTAHFLDEEFDKMYQTETQTSRLISTFSVLAIFLACLGLFGLASYSIVQRTKEIGIRKVLGASVPGIVGLMSKEFIRLVILALALATPVSWWLMQRWLADFAYRIDIEWWIFLLAGVVAVGIAFITVGLESIRAAMANPVQSLKSE